jgi:hypothetical protein
MVYKVALGQVFSEYFGFPCQFSFHRLLHIHHLSSGAGTIGKILANVPSGLTLPPPQETNKQTNKQERGLLGCDAVHFCGLMPKFPRNTPPTPSRMCRFQVQLSLRRTVSQSIRLGIQPPWGLVTSTVLSLTAA